MFKLNSLFTIDGTTTGNESKYINHASGDNANVRAYGTYQNSYFTLVWVFTKKKKKKQNKIFFFSFQSSPTKQNTSTSFSH